jgi:hypothetical protein
MLVGHTHMFCVFSCSNHSLLDFVCLFFILCVHLSLSFFSCFLSLSPENASSASIYSIRFADAYTLQTVGISGRLLLWDMRDDNATRPSSICNEYVTLEDM